ncbi:MAG: hypothetical protein M5R36_18860 [Deltaproteobacteria bacterium]|nr:hypothetical protein [Deltaproteobacteria bacterium]
MKSWPYLLILVGVFAVFALAFGACDSGGDDDDDDDEPPFGEEIAGTYNAVMTVEVDSCNEENEGETEQWVLEITQSSGLAYAWVEYKEFGAGQDWVDLYQGDVYGTVILKAGVETSPISGQECTKISVQDFNLKVDLETNEISGRLATDIFYMGNGCDSSNIDCNFEQSITPGTPAE